MRPDSRAAPAILLVVVLVIAAGGVAFVLTAKPSALPTALPIAAGTNFSLNDTRSWAAYFNVSAPGARLVGAWTAFDVRGPPALWVFNRTWLASGVHALGCLAPSYSTEYEGSIDVRISPGAYYLIWSYCSFASDIVITRTVQVVPGPSS